MPPAQLIDDPIQRAHMLEPDPLWIPSSFVRPPRLAEIAVHIPLDELDLLLREQCIERRIHPCPHILPRQIQHQLVAPLGTRPVTKMVHPIRMRAVQITVRIHHLRLNPQAKTHPQRMHPRDQRVQAMRELLRIDRPIAQPRVFSMTHAEPPVINHEHLDPKLGRLLGKLHLVAFIDGEFRRLPRIVQHRPYRLRCLGEDLFAFIGMPAATDPPKPFA